MTGGSRVSYISVLLDVMDIDMTNEHREHLQTKRHLLIKAINPEPLVAYLYANNVLTSKQKQDIQSKPTRIGQCDALLDVIEGLPDWTYYQLLDCLHATEQEHVVGILCKGKLNITGSNAFNYGNPL